MSSNSISVIIPTFNRALFLKEAVGSVLSQTYESFELIVVDDGSTDETREVVSSFNDPRIIYLYQKNSGVSAARNLGFSMAKAPYIALLDSDDLWLPDKLKVQFDFFQKNPDVAICQTEELWLRCGKRVNPCKKHQKKSGWIFEDCLPLCIISPSAVMMKCEVWEKLGGFDEAMPICEDYDLWLRAALRYEIHTLPQALIVKRGGHLGQLSAKWGQDRYRIVALEKILTDPMLPENMKTKVKSEIIRRAKIVADGARKRGNEEMKRVYEEKCIAR